MLDGIALNKILEPDFGSIYMLKENLFNPV